MIMNPVSLSRRRYGANKLTHTHPLTAGRVLLETAVAFAGIHPVGLERNDHT